MEPLGNDRLRILSCIASEAAYLPNSSAVPEPKTCQSTCRNIICEENCKYKRKENSPLEITYSARNSGPSSPSTMSPPVQATLGRDLSLEIPPPLLTPISNSNLTTLTALVQDFRLIHTPPSGDPSLFQCTFHNATIIEYNNFTGITSATRADLQGSIHLDLDDSQAAKFVNT